MYEHMAEQLRRTPCPPASCCLQRGLHGKGQAEQMKEARGIRLVRYRICAEGRQILTVQAGRRCGSRRNEMALVQLERHITGHMRLRVVHKGGQRLAQGRVPLAGVNDIGKCLRHQRLYSERSPWPGTAFPAARGQNTGGCRPASRTHRGCVMPTRRCSTMVDDADAVRAAHSGSALAAGCWPSWPCRPARWAGPVFKMNGNIGGRVGRLLGRDAKLQKARVWRNPARVQGPPGPTPRGKEATGVYPWNNSCHGVMLQRHMVRLCRVDLLCAARGCPIRARER